MKKIIFPKKPYARKLIAKRKRIRKLSEVYVFESLKVHNIVYIIFDNWYDFYKTTKSFEKNLHFSCIIQFIHICSKFYLYYGKTYG